MNLPSYKRKFNGKEYTRIAVAHTSRRSAERSIDFQENRDTHYHRIVPFGTDIDTKWFVYSRRKK